VIPGDQRCKNGCLAKIGRDLAKLPPQFGGTYLFGTRCTMYIVDAVDGTIINQKKIAPCWKSTFTLVDTGRIKNPIWYIQKKFSNRPRNWLWLRAISGSALELD